MRIERLDLIAFGPFTNASLSFSEKPYALQLVYGPNEAGKSSSLRAIVELFFGFQNRSADDFLHSYAKLRIGAKLAFPDKTTLSVVRRKAAKNTLRDESDDAVVDESIIQSHLGNVDRELFRHMFGIDHQSLRAGGREMVEGNGKVGETLFSAAAGISKLRSAQKSLLAQADELFKSNAKSSKLRKLIEEYQALKKQQSDALVSADIWKARGDTLTRLLEKQASLKAAHSELAQRKDWLQQVINSANPIAQLKQARIAIKSMKELPKLPTDFGSQCDVLLVGLRDAQARIKQVDESLRQLDKDLESIADVSLWISYQAEIEELLEDYGKHKAAVHDRPKRDGKRSEIFLRMQSNLRNLGLPTENSDIDSLRLPTDKLVRIRELGNQRQGIYEKLHSLQREHSTIAKDIDKAQADRFTFAAYVGWEALESKLKQHRSDVDLEDDLEQLDSDLQLLEAEIRAGLQRLQLSHLAPSKLTTLSVISDARLHEFDEQFRAFDQRKAKLADQILESESEKTRLEHELALLETERTIPSETELSRLRTERDLGWQLISQLLSNETVSETSLQSFLDKAPSSKNLPAAFESYLTATDTLADELRWHADKVTAKSRILAEVIRNQKKLEKLLVEEAKITQDHQSLIAQWNEVWAPIEIKPHSPSQMRDWLDDFEAVRKQQNDLAGKLLKREKLMSKLQLLTNEFRELLGKVVGESFEGNESLKALLQLADDVVSKCKDKQSRQSQIEETLAQDRTRFIDCEIDLAQAKEEWEQWQADWASEMQRIRLEKDAHPAQANCVLQELQELFQLHEDYLELTRRIDGIDRDATHFTQRLEEISGQLGVVFANQSVEQTIRQLRAGHEQAVAAEEKRKTLIEQRETLLSGRQAIIDQRRTTSAQLDELCKLAHCDDPHLLPAIVVEAEGRLLKEKEVGELEKQLITLARNQPLDEFILACDLELPRLHELPLECSAIEVELESKQKEYEQTLQEVKSARDELNQIDGSAKAAEIAERIQCVASEIEDACRETITLRLASTMLANSMEMYRERNQGPVLGLASTYFSRMTLEKYRAIHAEFDEQGNPSLVGIRRDGTSVAVNGMSDGTCDQLFLSLRLASLQVWLDKHPPIPFIVDDILVHFDEDRAEATLKVLHDFSKRTQVLFFTHHEHTIRLAQKTLNNSEFQVVRLADSSLSATS